jgi:phage-related minor tail protein
MAVSLSSLRSLRVVTDGDSSGYVASMNAKAAADAKAVASGDSLGQSLARTDAALDKVTPGTARLSKGLLDGYGAASTFERTIRSIGDALDRGMGVDRANALLDAAYSKFKLVADSATLARQGYASLVPAVDALNAKLSLQSEIMDRATQSTAKSAAAQQSQASINSRLGVTEPGSSTSARGADIAAYGASLDSLREKYDPLFAAGRSYKSTLDEINMAARVGALTEDQRSAAIDRTKTAFAGQVTAMNTAKGVNDNFGQSVGAASGHIQSLEAVVRHVADSIAAGTPPLQAFGREIGNLSYGLSGGALKSIGDTITGLLTPVRLAVGALGGIGVGAAAAAISWQSSQQSIALSLAGIGKAAGASVSDINKIAEATASTAALSIGEARGIAEALAQTGKIGKDSFAPIIGIVHDFGATTGQSVSEAGKLLAGAFQDPVKGAQQLDEKLGFLDDRTKTLIQSLSASGDRQAAQNALLQAMTPSLTKASDLTTGWARAWSTVANSASDAFTKIGRGLSEIALGPSGLDKQIEQAQARLGAAQERQAGTRPGTPGTLSARPYEAATADVTRYSAALEALRGKQAQLQTDAETKRLNDFSKSVGDVIGQLVPATKASDELATKLDILNRAMADPALASHLAHSEALGLADQRAAAAKATLLDPITKQTQAMELQVAAMDKRSNADRIDQAMRAKTLELSGQEITAEEKLRQVQLAGQLAGGGQTGADREVLSHISALGEFATIADKLLAKQLELNEANRSGAKITGDQQAALLRLTELEETQSRLQAKSSAGLADDRDISRVIDLQRRSLVDKGLLDPSDALKLADANTVLAKSFRTMSDAAAVAKSPLEGLKKLELDGSNFRNLIDSTAVSSLNSVASSLTDITMGSKTAKAGFQDMSTAIVRALEEMLIKITIITPLAKALQATLGGFFGGGGAAGPVGGGILTGLYHAGGTMAEPSSLRFVAPGTFDLAPRFHSGIGPGELPAILRRDESVLTPKQMAQLAPAYAGAGGGVGGNTQVNITNNSGGEVKTRRRQSGGKSVIDVVVGAVGEKLAGGSFDGPMQARYGNTIKPKSR